MMAPGLGERASEWPEQGETPPCGCDGSGLVDGPSLHTRDPSGRGSTTRTYVYCECKSGEALRLSHCRPHSNRFRLESKRPWGSGPEVRAS